MRELQPTQGAAGHPGRAPGLPTVNRLANIRTAMNARHCHPERLEGSVAPERCHSGSLDRKCRIIMKTTIFLIALGLCPLMTLQAEPSSGIGITISKNSSKDLQVVYRSSRGSTRKSGTDSTYFTINISNHSISPLKELVVEWKIKAHTYKPTGISNSSSGSDRIVAGEKKVQLNVGESITFDTEPIDLYFSNHHYATGFSTKLGDQIDGCLVKVVQGGKVLAVACDPQEAIDHFASHTTESLKK